MTLLASVGQARALDGREAGMQATHLALNTLGSNSPTLGIVISSYLYDPQQVINGVVSLLGNTPIIGFSTPAGMTSGGLQPHSVVLALLAGTDARADVTWLAGYTQGSREVSQQLADLLQPRPEQPSLLFADGFNADAEQLCANLAPGTKLAGALSSGDLHAGNAYQIGNTFFGAGGLALARLEGNIRVGVGYGHGWQPVGTHFRVTRSRGFWVRTLDGRPASESYARLFGYPARDWAFPPLDHMTRLYPLGLEQPNKNLVLRAPLRVEADGSFRMNATVGDGREAYLLVGSLSACQTAAAEASKRALAALNGARPVLALVLADISWQMLFEALPGADIAAVREALGPRIPIAGGYTLGQIVPGSVLTSPQFLNQHMAVMIFGEAEEKK
jgi:hypothetical protein